MKLSSTETFLKAALEKHATIQRKPQNQTRWHWLLLILFGLLVFGTLFQQLLIIGVITLLVAIIKGPVLAFWGVLYSTVLAFFPPLGLILSLLFFVLNLGAVLKSWRITFVSGYFYLLPFLLPILKQHLFAGSTVQSALLMGISILGFHFLLEWLYQNNSLSRVLTWRIVCVPYDLLLLILPKRFFPMKKTFRKIKKK